MSTFKYIESKNSNKLSLDKYYTPQNVVEKCIDIIEDAIGFDNISEVIEPSAGNGSFLNVLDDRGIPYTAYDILPEDSRIIEVDYLDTNLEYLKDRIVLGNPPFGRSMSLARKFYNYSVEHSDYIAFILPISQLNNTSFLYKFDLILSKDLGKIVFSDNREVHCCFNIYKRPVGSLNKKPNFKLNDVSIIRQDSSKYEDIVNFDLRMCYWGDPTAGKILSEGETYSGEYKIVIHNDKLRAEIVEVLKTTNWKEVLNNTAMVRIKQKDIVLLLKDKIEGIN